MVTYTWICTCAHTAGAKLSKPLPTGWPMLSVKSSVTVSSCSSPQSRRGQKRFVRSISSVGPTQGLPLYDSVTFCPSEFCSYSFRVIHLFSRSFPIQIGLHVYKQLCTGPSGQRAPPGWCSAAWVLGRAWAVCLFSIAALSAGMTSTSFPHSHLETRFVPGLRRTGTQGFH